MLIEAGARVNVRNELGITPLMLACENGSPKMIEKLLAAGADPNIVSPTGQSALMIAARTSSTDAISALLAHGANVNAKEASRNQTALIWAVAEHRPDVARVLIDHGADINARSLTINELIYRENPDPSDENAAKGQPHPVGEVIARGGSTPFLMAAREGDIASATLLLAAGANINDTAPDGTSALVIAAYSDHDAFAAFLLDHGADPNGAAAGYTALHIAVLTANSELVRALLAHGANPNAQLTMGTPVRRFEEDLVLPQSLAGATPFLVAARLAEVDIMRILAAAGANPQAATRIGVTPLMAAVVPDRRSLALRSLQAEQAANQTLEAVRLILQLGADVNETNAEGDTALHIAAWKGANAIIRLLVEKGAKLDVKNKVGQTPLSLTKNTLLSESPRRRLRSTANLLQELGATK
jgi:ankyrin repeat protein